MRPIPSAPEYFATDEGEIFRNGRVLRISTNGRGYIKVKLSMRSVRRDAYVHRLICEAFHGPCPTGMQCRHLDGNKANNRPSNLVWGTRDENAVDRQIHGTLREGANHHRAVLTVSQVVEARRRARNGEQVDVVAADMGLPYRPVLDAVAGRRYGSIAGAVTSLPKGMQRRQAEARAAGIKILRKSNARDGESPQKSPQDKASD